ncbi:MAG: ABC transporter ATP-binding protein/permease [Caldilinea sp.]|nr:ABC transporter ATP-binding protein/permease [Caldilinea sp.]MDW8440094.1 ABC transporter ATP-binding protein [Caldilineaceae bacterium]
MTSSEFTVVQPWRSNRKSAGRWIFSHVRRNWPLIVVILAGAIGNAALAAAIPIFTGQAFDAVTGGAADLRTLGIACLLLVFSQLVRSGLQLGRNFGSEVLGQRLERDARRELYGELLGKSMGFHDMHATGDVMARATNDVRELALMMAPGLNLVIGSAIFLVMPIVVAPRYHPTLVIVPVLFAIGYLLAMWHYLRSLQPVTAAVRRTFGRMNARLTEAIEGIETVKGAAQEEREVALFERNATRVRDAVVAQARVEARFLPLLLLAVATGVAFGQALYLYHQGVITVGAVAAYVGLISLFDFPVFTSLFAYSQVASGLSSARRILELIREQAVVDQNVGGYTGQMRGAVTFDRVTFRYHYGDGDTAQHALEDVSFFIEAGQTLALVGQTGAGKSTVAKLINRIYDVDAGCIAIDGVDVRNWNLEALRRQISIIEQDIFLFSRSIAENIAFGKPDATQQEIEEAARAAQAHDFIMSFPEGYATVVGERGVMLSGGQRQRIALARAFLTNPAILILDDSTSAIDSATEDQIQRAIERASQGRTTILITHRLSQIRWADKIVVLRKGRVVAQGTHTELLERSQAYRDIFARL